MARPTKSLSLFQLRLRKFRRLKRGYYSFLLLLTLYVLSFLLPFFMGRQALVVQYQGKTYYPALQNYLFETFGYYKPLGFFQEFNYPATEFGQPEYWSRCDYKKLQEKFELPGRVRDLIRLQQQLIENAAPDRLTDLVVQYQAAERQVRLAVDIERLKGPIEGIGALEDIHRDLSLEAARAAGAIAASNFGDIEAPQRTVLERLQEFQKELDGLPDLKGNYVLMPIFPYGPLEQFTEGTEENPNPPHPPSRAHWMGTDDRGRDVLVRLAYGFRVSISFALLVTALEYVGGILVGAMLGYFGRWVDLIGLRFVEIWGSLPFLYTIMILSDQLGKSFPLLVMLMVMFSWMGISYYIRGEFYREKARDYVAAARAVGEGELSIMLRHILPNALTPIITFAPFAIVGNISALLALDYLGFGLPTEVPSWGELIGQGKAQVTQWHLVVFPLLIVFITLQLVVFIGEAVREAFDPKVFSRLR